MKKYFETPETNAGEEAGAYTGRAPKLLNHFGLAYSPSPQLVSVCCVRRCGTSPQADATAHIAQPIQPVGRIMYYVIA